MQNHTFYKVPAYNADKHYPVSWPEMKNVLLKSGYKTQEEIEIRVNSMVTLPIIWQEAYCYFREE